MAHVINPLGSRIIPEDSSDSLQHSLAIKSGTALMALANGLTKPSNMQDEIDSAKAKLERLEKIRAAVNNLQQGATFKISHPDGYSTYRLDPSGIVNVSHYSSHTKTLDDLYQELKFSELSNLHISFNDIFNDSVQEALDEKEE